MSNVILVTSGKGGVGKSTIAAGLGMAFASQHRKTVLVEMDIGLRGLDLFFDVEDRAVYDLGNIARNECAPSDGIIPVTRDGFLSLIVAPAGISTRLNYEQVIPLCKVLSKYYDTVIIDAPAGIGVSLLLAPQVADLVLMAVTPDRVCVRDAGRLADLLEQQGVKNTRMIINKVSRKEVKASPFKDLDEVIDQVGVQLIGVIPLDVSVSEMGKHPEWFRSESGVSNVFFNIAQRISGENVDLLIR